MWTLVHILSLPTSHSFTKTYINRAHLLLRMLSCPTTQTVQKNWKKKVLSHLASYCLSKGKSSFSASYRNWISNNDTKSMFISTKNVGYEWRSGDVPPETLEAVGLWGTPGVESVLVRKSPGVMVHLTPIRSPLSNWEGTIMKRISRWPTSLVSVGRAETFSDWTSVVFCCTRSFFSGYNPNKPTASGWLSSLSVSCVDYCDRHTINMVEYQRCQGTMCIILTCCFFPITEEAFNEPLRICWSLMW